MSARVKTPGADVSSLVDELRDQAEKEVTTPDEASDAASQADDADEASPDSEIERESEQAEPDPRLEAKIVDKAPCDRLDDLSQAADEAPDELVRIVEGLIFASPHPLHVREAAQILEDYEPLAVQAAFKILSLGRPGSGLQLSRSAQGYRWTTDPAHAPYVQRLVMAKPQRLSRPQLETLAVIAYRQPVTRPEIDHIRGVDSQATIKALVDRDLIAVVGQTADPGRPRLYGTTLFFLEYLNITELQSLPPLGELDQLSERTRELLRSKVGVDEAERLSAQVLALAKAQDEAAARGEDASQVVVEPKEASGDEQDEPEQEQEEGALAQAEEGETSEAEDESEQEAFAQVEESGEGEAQDDSEREAFAQAEVSEEAEAQDDSEQEAFAQAEVSEEAEAQDDSEQEAFAQAEEGEEVSGDEQDEPDQEGEEEAFAQAEEGEEVSGDEQDEPDQEGEEEVLARAEVSEDAEVEESEEAEVEESEEAEVEESEEAESEEDEPEQEDDEGSSAQAEESVD